MERETKRERERQRERERETDRERQRERERDRQREREANELCPTLPPCWILQLGINTTSRSKDNRTGADHSCPAKRSVALLN